MPVWTLDLEVERHREMSAAELCVLRHIEAGVGEPREITRRIGMGEDTRLTEQVLVRLLAALAIEPKGDQFILTETGGAWIAGGGATARERVTFDVRLDPARVAFEWVDSERSVYATQDTWTIELPAVDDDLILTRKPEIARLVQEAPLPDEHERAPHERRPPVELRAFAILERRLHWRAVRVDEWRHEERKDAVLVLHVGDAENPRLTELLANFVTIDERRRIARK
ncbi:MAG: hypothetical protein IT373_02080 [Polyangiaceae bacterium]|nr:hypothetical protein [Polyangiaceae bacterium]